jgi:hypothetical protein
MTLPASRRRGGKDMSSSSITHEDFSSETLEATDWPYTTSAANRISTPLRGTNAGGSAAIAGTIGRSA